MEALSNRAFRVALANGHRLLGFVASRASGGALQLAVGDRVWLELSSYDLTEGRIVEKAERI